MFFKWDFGIVVTLLVAIAIEPSTTHRVCTLDDMKLLAAEACEHLFQNDVGHSQQKRDVSNDIPNKHAHNHFDAEYHQHTKVRIHRRDFPKGGYLLINNNHAKVLHRMRHEPEYRIMPLKSYQKRLLEQNALTQEGGRGKRENTDPYIHMPYCCVNKCRMDFFCRK